MDILAMFLLATACLMVLGAETTVAQATDWPTRRAGRALYLVAAVLFLMSLLDYALGADDPAPPAVAAPKETLSQTVGDVATVHVTHLTTQKLRVVRAPAALAVGDWDTLADVHLDSCDNVAEDIAPVQCMLPGEYELYVEIDDAKGAAITTVAFHFIVAPPESANLEGNGRVEPKDP